MPIKEDKSLLMFPNKVKPDHACLFGIISYVASKLAEQKLCFDMRPFVQMQGCFRQMKKNHRSVLQLLALLWFYRLCSFLGFQHSHICCASQDPLRIPMQPRLGYCKEIASVLCGALVASNAPPHKFLVVKQINL